MRRGACSLRVGGSSPAFLSSGVIRCQSETFRTRFGSPKGLIKSAGGPNVIQLVASTAPDVFFTLSKKYSTRTKDAGIAIRYSRGILFYAAGSRNGLEGLHNGGRGHKEEVDPKNNIRLL